MYLKEKFEFYKQNKNELAKAVISCILILILISITVLVATQFKDEFKQTINTAKQVITPRYWEIKKVTPNSNNSSFTLNLISNIGNVRNYDDIVSYGLSLNGQLLAVHRSDGLFIINLEDESKKSIKTPSDKFSGDIGEVIHWNMDNSYFVLPVLVANPKQTEIWVFTNQGNLLTSINAAIPVKESGKSILEPVYFSMKTNSILTRIYKIDDLDFIKEEGKTYSIYNLPIYLVTYNLKGGVIEEFKVRDYDTSGTNILYFWDYDSNVIEYNIYKESPPEKSRDYLFTKQGVKNG